MLLTVMANLSHGAPSVCEGLFLESPQGYILSEFPQGAQDFYKAKNLATKIQQLEPSVREEWILGLGEVYRKVPKKNPNPTAAWHIGGRRLLDYSLLLIERHDLVFAEGIASGIKAEKLYTDFLTRQNQIFRTSYGGREIMSYARFLLAELNRLGADYRRSKIILGGSFINGKADLSKSDLDMSITDPRLGSLKTEWEETLNQKMESSGLASALKIEMHIEPAEFYGKINTFVLVIDQNKISLLVFEPALLGTRAAELATPKATEYILQQIL